MSSEPNSGQPPKGMPRVNFANFTAPFKDPVPPMLSKDYQQKTGEKGGFKTVKEMPMEGFQGRPKQSFISREGQEYQKRNDVRFYFPGESED